LYVSQISAYNLEVLSLLMGKLRFDLKPEISLEITSPNLAGVSPGPVNIRAVALPVGTYYRMDAAQLPGDKMIWPVKDVLLPAGLSDNRIGLFGWIEADPEKIFVPLRVEPQGKSSPAQEENSLQLMFRAMTEVDSIVWRSSMETDEFSGSLKWQDLVKTPVPSGQPVTLTLPPGPQTILRIEVAAKERNGDQWSILKIRVFRPGPHDGK
jgi:hypothetical protein